MKVKDVVALTSWDNMVILTSPQYKRATYNDHRRIPEAMLDKTVTSIYGTEYFGYDAIEITYVEG